MCAKKKNTKHKSNAKSESGFIKGNPQGQVTVQGSSNGQAFMNISSAVSVPELPHSNIEAKTK